MSDFNEINYAVHWKIHEGQHDAFKALAEKCNAHVEENEKGTLYYRWYMDGKDGNTAHLLERHETSESMLGHLQSIGPLLGQLLEISDITAIDAYGDASDDAKAALAQFGSVPASFLSGFNR